MSYSLQPRFCPDSSHSHFPAHFQPVHTSIQHLIATGKACRNLAYAVPALCVFHHVAEFVVTCPKPNSFPTAASTHLVAMKTGPDWVRLLACNLARTQSSFRVHYEIRASLKTDSGIQIPTSETSVWQTHFPLHHQESRGEEQRVAQVTLLVTDKAAQMG